LNDRKLDKYHYEKNKKEFQNIETLHFDNFLEENKNNIKKWFLNHLNFKDENYNYNKTEISEYKGDISKLKLYTSTLYIYPRYKTKNHLTFISMIRIYNSYGYKKKNDEVKYLKFVVQKKKIL